MTKQFLKTLLAGILAGAVLFNMPFLLIRAFIFFAFIAAIFKLLSSRKRRHGKGFNQQFAYGKQPLSTKEHIIFMRNKRTSNANKNTAAHQININ